MAELERCGSAYEKLGKRFAFLAKLHSLESLDVCDGARNLKIFYPEDLGGISENKCLHLRAHLLLAEATGGKGLSLLELYMYILEKCYLGIYPNVEI